MKLMTCLAHTHTLPHHTLWFFEGKSAGGPNTDIFFVVVKLRGYSLRAMKWWW